MAFDRTQFVNDLCRLAEMDVPFLHQGQCAETGMDCINIARWAYRRQGLNLPAELEQEFTAYHPQPDGWRMLTIMRKWFIEVSEVEARSADLYQIFVRKNPKHMAVRVSDDLPPLIVEAYRSDDGHVSRALKQPLDSRRRVAGIFRIPDFA